MSNRKSIRSRIAPENKIIIDVAQELDARGIDCDLRLATAAIENTIRYDLEHHFSDMLENGGVEFEYMD